MIVDQKKPETALQPSLFARLKDLRPYQSSTPGPHVDLRLDCNEGLPVQEELLHDVDIKCGEILRRYPSTRLLETQLASRFSVGSDEVLVTAGADDALDRVCRAVLAPGRDLILPEPTFEMLRRYATLTGANIVRVNWLGAFPIERILQSVTPDTAAIAVVSPNNPTGAVVTPDDLEKLSEAVPQALLIVDLAYAEFADDDLTHYALQLPNAVVIRSMSKAWGLAGLRVGYAIGSSKIIDCMRAVGEPYPVSGLSLAIASSWLERGRKHVESFIRSIRSERSELTQLLQRLGQEPYPSQANFVCARFRNAEWVRDGLAGLGIAVRAFPDCEDLTGFLRVTCPGDSNSYQRLKAGLETVITPQALLFDLDGVLADVSRSYRVAIQATIESFGVRVDQKTISQAKASGNANNDWELSRRLLRENGVDVPLNEIVRSFEDFYQGTPEAPGLRKNERLITSPAFLRRLATKLNLGVVTGRPRCDAERFLNENGIREFFRTIVCMEDAPAKPDPAPVRLALDRLGAQRAWMIGDSPDDVRAARLANVVPLGISAPGDDPAIASTALEDAGAARVLSNIEELESLLR